MCVKEIHDAEGEQSQNPRIAIIQALEIELDDDMDAEAHLVGLGFQGFKKGTNVKIFKAMTADEWRAADQANEVETFIGTIYQKLGR